MARAETRRVVAQFSCGAASACAWKMAVDRYGDAVIAINAYIASEDDDNRRFLADCERWIGRPVTVLRDEKFGADPVQISLRMLDPSAGRFEPISLPDCGAVCELTDTPNHDEAASGAAA